MIIRWPGGAKGCADNGLHYNLDLGPTLAELLNIKSPELWQGQSYAASLNGYGATGRDYLVLSQCAHVCQRSVRWGDYIWIRSWHDGFHLFDDEMLFNLKDDPFETKNLAADEPEHCAQARAKYEEWHLRMMETMPEGWGDPMDTVLEEGGPFHARRGKIRVHGYDSRLEATDRKAGLAELRKRHPQEFE
jgi:arylsulfatase A-like enzyme